jgi:hypothetical protein
MSVYTDAERADAAALIHKLLFGDPHEEFTITTIGEAAAAIEACARWIADAIAGGAPAKWVAYQAAAAAWYIAGAARQLVAEAQLHAALAAAELTS